MQIANKLCWWALQISKNESKTRHGHFNWNTHVRLCSQLPLVQDKPAATVSRTRTGKTSQYTPKVGFDGGELVQFLSEQGLSQAQCTEVVQAMARKRQRALIRSENVIAMIRYLQTFGVGVDKVVALVKSSFYLFVQDLEIHVKPKVQLFESLGVDQKGLRVLCLQYPYALYGSVEDLRSHIQFWESVPLKREDVCRVIIRHPRLLRSSVERSLQPRLELFKTLGLTEKHLRILFTLYPRVFSRAISKIHEVLDVLQELGFRRGTESYLKAFAFVATKDCGAVISRFECLLGSGFTREEARLILQKQPSLLARSVEDLRKKATYLVGVMKRPLSDAVKFPGYFNTSFEATILPRHEAFVKWKLKNSVQKEYSLGYVFHMSRERFNRRFCG